MTGDTLAYMRVLTVLVAIAGLIAGCATSEQARSPAQRAPTAASPGINLSGYSQAFRAGYADGCTSVDAARKRDETRFKSDADYAQGWRDGYSICKSR